MKKSATTQILLLILLMPFNGLKSQNDYYWYDGKKIYLEDYNKKKYIVVDSTITSESELIRALNDSSISVQTFQQTNVLYIINVYDSTLSEKHYAIIESQDNIDEKYDFLGLNKTATSSLKYPVK